MSVLAAGSTDDEHDFNLCCGFKIVRSHVAVRRADASDRLASAPPSSAERHSKPLCSIYGLAFSEWLVGDLASRRDEFNGYDILQLACAFSLSNWPNQSDDLKGDRHAMCWFKSLGAEMNRISNCMRRIVRRGGFIALPVSHRKPSRNQVSVGEAKVFAGHSSSAQRSRQERDQFSADNVNYAQTRFHPADKSSRKCEELTSRGFSKPSQGITGDVAIVVDGVMFVTTSFSHVMR